MRCANERLASMAFFISILSRFPSFLDRNLSTIFFPTSGKTAPRAFPTLGRAQVLLLVFSSAPNISIAVTRT